MTSNVGIFSISFPLLPVSWRHLNFFFKFVLLCCVVSNQLRKSSVITYFHSNSSAATSSATRKNGTVPERPTRNEEQDSINVCKRCTVRPDKHFSMKSWIPCIISFNLTNLLVLLLWENMWSFIYTSVFCVNAWISTLMSQSERLSSYVFRRKVEKTQSMREEMDGKVLISRQSWNFLSL